MVRNIDLGEECAEKKFVFDMGRVNVENIQVGVSLTFVDQQMENINKPICLGNLPKNAKSHQSKCHEPHPTS